MPEAQDQAAIRDIPRSCTCGWDWTRRRAAEPDYFGVYRLPAGWTRTAADPDCIWHKREMAS